VKSADQHRLARSIRRLAIGVVRDVETRRTGRAANTVDEREEQFQIAISGTATDYPFWQAVELPLLTAFTIATGSRDSTLQRPQASFGYELTAVQRINDENVWEPVSDGVILSAAVRDYHFDAAHAIDRVTVLLAAIAPGDELQFTGFVHVTFQGFGAPRETQPDEAP
jgi:hypothetical protein